MLQESYRDSSFWYWFGFIYGDGSVDSVGRLTIALSATDINHLYKFKLIFGGTITEFKATCQNEIYPAVRLYLPLSKSKDFVKLGIKKNKTYIEERILCKVPDEYKIDFIRGYFDADGSISLKSGTKTYVFGIVSKNRLILEEISEYLKEKLGFECLKVSQDSGVFRIRLSGNKKLELLRDILYDGATDFLDRKKLVFFRVESHSFRGYCFHKKSKRWRITVKPFVGKVFETEDECKNFIRENHETITCKVVAT